jgi:hypothetical protein
MDGFVMANGSLSYNQSGEGDIRKNSIEAGPGGLHRRLPGAAILHDADFGLPVVIERKNCAGHPTA